MSHCSVIIALQWLYFLKDTEPSAFPINHFWDIGEQREKFNIELPKVSVCTGSRGRHPDGKYGA